MAQATRKIAAQRSGRFTMKLRLRAVRGIWVRLKACVGTHKKTAIYMKRSISYGRSCDSKISDSGVSDQLFSARLVADLSVKPPI